MSATIGSSATPPSPRWSAACASPWRLVWMRLSTRCLRSHRPRHSPPDSTVSSPHGVVLSHLRPPGVDAQLLLWPPVPRRHGGRQRRHHRRRLRWRCSPARPSPRRWRKASAPAAGMSPVPHCRGRPRGYRRRGAGRPCGRRILVKITTTTMATRVPERSRRGTERFSRQSLTPTAPGSAATAAELLWPHPLCSGRSERLMRTLHAHVQGGPYPVL
mmetsp:Transcript_170142/g.545617  ORF Transcript_170142/g.545617 Transcript_170142/m.545617 type:complete len:216 (+) Transcript_170142:2296-2943(+)